MGILLFIIATILWLPLTIVNWVFVAFQHGMSNEYFKQTAVDIDRFGNHNFRCFLNATMQVNGYEFGDVRETISSALGKNQRDGTLSKFGKGICIVLDKLDKNHCKKSIKELE
jgi:hypothetical protein